MFIGLLDGKVLALDSGTGNVIWNFNTTDSVHSSPMIYNGIVYIASRSGKLYALDESTGRQRWVADLGYKTDATPALDPATGTLFVGTFGGYVHAVNASTGDTRGSRSSTGLSMRQPRSPGIPCTAIPRTASCSR